MESFCTMTRFSHPLDRARIFHILSCDESSPAFDQVREAYDQWEREFLRIASPRALLSFVKADEAMAGGPLEAGADALVAVMTLGGEVSRLSTRLFSQGDCLGGMVVYAMADDYLFGMDEQVQIAARRMCAQRGLGISGRLEAPAGCSMSAAAAAVRLSGALQKLGVRLTEGLMIDPVKSNVYVLTLTHDPAVFKAQHDCSACPDKGCRMRELYAGRADTPPGRILVTIEAAPPAAVHLRPGQSLLDALPPQMRPGISCGGKGTCGKCRIRLMEGTLPVTPYDRACFSEEEITSGLRLACKAFPTEDIRISLPAAGDAGFEVLASYRADFSGGQDGKDARFGIAVDLGTTTLAMQLVGLDSGRIYAAYTSVNGQRRFGADVISRIQASNEGHGPALRDLARAGILAGAASLLRQSGVRAGQVQKLALCGNTTMIHLLMGYPCHTLGVAPFEPYSVDRIDEPFEAVFGQPLLSCRTTILPGLGAYVGGDIVAGLLYCGMDRREEHSVLMDIGTNGEIALGNREGIWCTSTAAGPAFEGGGISCGTGSVAGAVSRVVIQRSGEVRPVTIGGAPPLGICGSGIISVAAGLLSAGLMDETGLMAPELGGVLVLSENVSFTQRDVREVQLAKAAIRAGLEALLNARSISGDKIGRVALAGGFGSSLDIEEAALIGLLPEKLKAKTLAVGNSALGGAVLFLTDERALDRIDGLLARARVINLAETKGFNDLFMEHMTFE